MRWHWQRRRAYDGPSKKLVLEEPPRPLLETLSSCAPWARQYKMCSMNFLANSFDPPRTAVRSFLVAALLMALCFGAGALAKAQDFSHIRIVRLSLIEGNVQYQRPGEEWQDAKLNLPIQQGYALRTDDGYAEVEFETGLEMRLASNSSVEFTELSLANGGLVTRLHVSAGTASVDAKLSKADQLSFAVSNFQVNVPHDARFRVDTSAAQSWVSVSHGKVAVQSAAAPIMLGGGRAIHETADDLASLQIEKDPPRDAFDKWVAQREEGLSDARADMSDGLHSNSYSTGFADLDFYGGWFSVSGYGWGWQPYGIAAGWVPFYSGQWMFMGNTGWNWVSAEPWGWLPYHFGSWVNAPGIGWVWMPQGSLAWQPATATWVQTGGQVGWTPVLATPLKPSKSASGQPAAPSRTLIVASSASGGIIAASRVVPLAPADAAAAHIVVPVAPAHTLSSAAENAAVTAFPASRVFSTAFNARPLLQAPRTAPIPRVISGGAPATGFSGVRGGGVPGGVGRMGGARAGASAPHMSGGGSHASSGGGHR